MLAFCFMNIQAAAKYLEQGYRIRRKAWAGVMYAFITYPGEHNVWGFTDFAGKFSLSLDVDDLLADDWVVITEGIIKDFPITYQE